MPSLNTARLLVSVLIVTDQIRIKVLSIVLIFSGSPQPSVKWFRNSREITATEDVMISFDGTNAKLQIEDVLPEDSADFICLAQNEAGEARTKATLTVMGKL